MGDHGSGRVAPGRKASAAGGPGEVGHHGLPLVVAGEPPVLEQSCPQP